MLFVVGKSYAEKEQWTSPDKAIIGGAKFIRNEYFENNQLNLYQMRWNPENPAQHQYAVTFAGQIKLPN